MKSLILLFSVLSFASAAFASGENEFNTKEPPGNSDKKEAAVENEAKKEVASPSVTLFNFSLFSFPAVDTVPSISTFGGTGRFRKATSTPGSAGTHLH